MPAEAPLLLLRADAGPGIGSGHVSRLLSLAEAWIDAGGRAELLTYAPSASLAASAGARGVKITAIASPTDLAAVARAVAAAPKGTWLAVDGYAFDADYLSALKKTGARVLRVDDGPTGEVACDAFLDQNPGAETGSPRLSSGALPLLGPHWALLRPAFARVGAARAPRAGTPRLLISFGGWDPENATSLALRALTLVKHPYEAVVIMPDNEHASALPELAKGLPVRLERGIDMAALMGKSDLGLIAGGVTMLEACAAGLPSLVAPIADNQLSGARTLGARGAVRLLDRASALTAETLASAIDALLGDASARAALTAAGRAAVDGLAAPRVAAALVALSEPKLSSDWTRLRPATPADAFEVWRIANEADVRAHSFRKEPIPLDEHLAWFEARLRDENARFWIVETGFVVSGQVRYVRAGGTAEVHYAVRGAFRGKGLGTLALSQSRKLACRELGVKSLTGVVISPNEPSERSFASAGWTKKGTETRGGAACAIFEALCS